MAADTAPTPPVKPQQDGKPVVYQVFTRLFGNTNTTNKPWGTIRDNGVGKFEDFTDTALDEIAQMGVSHIWYTGVPHHALVTDYTAYGISQDDPDVIKGRAGSPYAVKDYYNVNPDLAVDPANRLAEFEALIARTHAHGMKVIIDIVPNHVARHYESLSAPQGVSDFGETDDTSVTYARDNNFYYVVDEPFRVPVDESYSPLGPYSHPLADGEFEEVPAKWTGNGARAAQPAMHDWYETVKVNYGVRPDGSHDFPSLPDGFAQQPAAAHAAFWQGKDLPDSWYKFRDIAHYWLDKGVDGFRFDMAEMVPVEFWSFLNSSIKMKNPDAFLLAEVYQPDKYRAYLHAGKMDYLYDKVGFYDTLKTIMQGTGTVSALLDVHQQVSDIAPSMLHFLENHDEQRIASPAFAGDAMKGKPAMVVSALISASPIMYYFGQEVGEDGSEETGFGDPTRTTIFDYAGVPAHQRWVNEGAFDGGQLSGEERQLRHFYKSLLNIAASSPAVNGAMISLHQENLGASGNYSQQQLAFIRHNGDSRLLVITNFAEDAVAPLTVNIPAQTVSKLGLKQGMPLRAKLTSGQDAELTRGADGGLKVQLDLSVLESRVYAF
nr:alpha-amylase family protein [Alteromonas halophila]